jgi:cytochrome P450
VIIAGSDTTRAALVIQAALLLADREQWDAVCTDLNLVPGACREAMRFEPAVGTIPRLPRESISLDGHAIPPGRYLALSTMSALRDPDLYGEPDTFDIRRQDHPRWSLAFGGGAHRCLGEALATTELEEGLAALATNLPTLRVIGESLGIAGYGGIRRVTPLIVRWDN